jgi:hypothetical protein
MTAREATTLGRGKVELTVTDLNRLEVISFTS